MRKDDVACDRSLELTSSAHVLASSPHYAALVLALFGMSLCDRFSRSNRVASLRNLCSSGVSFLSSTACTFFMSGLLDIGTSIDRGSEGKFWIVSSGLLTLESRGLGYQFIANFPSPMLLLLPRR